MPKSANSTILTLIPKFPGATVIKDYRPISCCNTLYKLISKLLVSRLKPLLPKLIMPNQSAFIKGRLLLENCLLASEIVNGYHKNKGQKRITIKIDIAKAFDSIRWDFLIQCLCALQLPEIYINWLKECFTTTSYSVSLNGRMHGFFKGSRGLRQGDPLSPYLFGLAMNKLSQMLNDAAMEGLFAYHPKCRDSSLTHLCFADDLLIFSDGSPSSIQGILSILERFKLMSGLASNPDNSCFFACRLNENELSSIASIAGISQGTLPIRYLGLPLSSKKLSMLDCEPLFWCSAFVLPKEFPSTKLLLGSFCSIVVRRETAYYLGGCLPIIVVSSGIRQLNLETTFRMHILFIDLGKVRSKVWHLQCNCNRQSSLYLRQQSPQIPI